MPKTIRQSVTIKASPRAVYDALMDSRRHTAFTGGPAGPRSASTRCGRERSSPLRDRRGMRVISDPFRTAPAASAGSSRSAGSRCDVPLPGAGGPRDDIAQAGTAPTAPATTG